MTEALIERFEPFLTQLKNKTITEIKSAEAYAAAAQALLQVKIALKQTEARRREITAPAVEAAKKAAALFVPFEKDLTDAEAYLKDLLSNYVDQRVPQAAQEATAALNAGDRSALQTALAAVPHVDGIGLSTETSFEVIDSDAVPKQFLKTEIDRKAVLKALRAGEEIPGIVGIERTRVSVTVKE